MGLLLWSFASWAGAAAPEYQIKAVFLFNFTQFVEWPPESFPAADAPFVIGVVGEDPFGAHLDDAVRGESVKGRAVVIRRQQRDDDLSVCHVLFVSASEAGHVSAILRKLQGRSVLTVSDMDGFARGGGMIHFLTAQKKIGLQINLEAARNAKLSISSRLLRSAEIVPGGN